MENYFCTHFAHQSIVLKARDDRIPKSFSETCKCPAWASAIDREYDALIKRGTWKYVNSTRDMDPLPFTWNFWIKDTSSGDEMMYRARCWVCENLQMSYKDFDPDAPYALVVRHETIRMLLAKVVAQKLFMECTEVDNAYLYGDMDKPDIMNQPTNSSAKLKYSENICLVVKSLYGALEAEKIWSSHLHKKLATLNFKQFSRDQRLYYLFRKSRFIIPIIAIDDMACASSSKVLIDNFKHQLLTTSRVKFFRAS